ncbi:MAG: ribonuclease P protein component 1 [Methanomicrobiales archaeon]|nr:ribonuclease P protein component 1 [Methanomicrobiales archaeon]
MINQRNILRHELIGLPVMVMRASNPHHQGISGTVIDETRNMLRISTASGVKMIPKHPNTFRFTLPDGTMVDVDGSALVMSPEKRITLKTPNY